jgi:MFS family permease
VGSTLIIAQAVIADVFPGYERGEAMGAFMAPMLFGPVIAPLLGGIVAQLFGWRACFIMLSVMTGPILFLTYLFVPETHHYYVKQRVHRSDATATEDSLSNKAKDGYQSVSVTETVAIDEAGKHVEKTPEDGEGQAKPVSTSEESTKMIVSVSESVFDRYDPKEADRIKTLVVEHNHDYDTLGLTLIEAPMIAEPVFEKPWNALLLIFDPLMSPFMLTCATSFALMFSALTIAPILFVEEPYSLSEGVVGVTFLSFGIGALLGALMGGTLSDASQRAYPSCKQGRMVYVLYFSPWIVIGGMIFAYAMQYGIHLSMVLIAQFIIGFVQSAILTNCMVYLGEVKPDKAAAACAVMVFLCFSLAAICVACTVPAASVITLSGFFWVMSGAYILAVSGWCYVVYTELNKHSSAETVPTSEPAVDVETAEKVISLEMAENQVATIME